MLNLKPLIAALAPRFERRTTAEWLLDLERLGIPSGPVLSIEQMLSHPQTLARDMVPTIELPRAGPVKTIGLPVKFSATPGAVLDPAPVFGEHTREVLSEAGYSAAEIAALLDARAACDPAPEGERDGTMRQETPPR